MFTDAIEHIVANNKITDEAKAQVHAKLTVRKVVAAKKPPPVMEKDEVAVNGSYKLAKEDKPKKAKKAKKPAAKKIRKPETKRPTGKKPAKHTTYRPPRPRYIIRRRLSQ